MTDRARDIEGICQAALEREPGARAQFVIDACSGDAALRQEVESLLAQTGAATGFLETPAIVGAAREAAGMRLQPGTQLGPYEILEAIGSGGMGDVYKARDTRLHRLVAVKVLPALLAADSQFRERFEREARAVAALNHPHICTIHDVGHQEPADGGPPADFLVMEYLEGESVGERLERSFGRPLPFREALTIAIQISDALDKAHRIGIVHRDLKPGNIHLLRTGTASTSPVAKLLDFGLATADASTIGKGRPSVLMTAPSTLTTAGTMFGTVQYMAPEQLEGRKADARTDIFAFGAVLFEMLTGRKAFSGASQATLISAILRDEAPPVSSVQPLAPALLDHIVAACLAKDPDDRLQAARDLTKQLTWVAAGATQNETVKRSSTMVRGRLGWLVAAGLGVGLAAALLAGFGRVARPNEPVRFQIALPDQMTFPRFSGFAVSPDGRKLVFVATGADNVTRLWIRRLDSVEVKPLPGTEDSTGSPPFWSPDSRSVAFQAGDKLKKIDITGGSPQIICNISFPVGSQGLLSGGSWNREGVILFGLSGLGVVMRVSVAGGVASSVTQLDPARQEFGHGFPVFLPDGRHFIFKRWSRIPEKSTGAYVGSLDASPSEQGSQSLVDTLFDVAFVPNSGSGSGHLLFRREGTLMAQSFNERTFTLFGEPVPVAEQLGSFLSFGFFSVSTNGTLVYRTGSEALNSQLTWFDRQGNALGRVAEPAIYASVTLSPDSSQAVVTRFVPPAAARDIWLIDFAKDTSPRFTFGPHANVEPVWSPNGRKIVFASDRESDLNREDLFDLYDKPVNGGADQELLLKSINSKFPMDVSRDGRYLLYLTQDPKTKGDLWMLPFDGDRKPVPFQATSFNEGRATTLSSDGRWVAYESDESGRFEIYVREFVMNAAGRKWIVSKGGGRMPRSRKDGKELFYVAPDRTLMGVGVATSRGEFRAGTPKPLFKLPFGYNQEATPWDVRADGNRFLVAVPLQENSRTPFTVVLHWPVGLPK